MQHVPSESIIGGFVEVETPLYLLRMIQANYEVDFKCASPIIVIDATAAVLKAITPEQDWAAPKAEDNHRWLAGKYFTVRGGVVALWFPEPVSPKFPIGSIRLYVRGNVEYETLEKFLNAFDDEYYVQKFIVDKPRDRPGPERRGPSSKQGTTRRPFEWCLIAALAAVIGAALVLPLLR